jgi:hypothetical protein
MVERQPAQQWRNDRPISRIELRPWHVSKSTSKPEFRRVAAEF